MIINPFPERGLATRKSYYYQYWKNKYKNFDKFVENINPNDSFFLTIAGELGAGKTATLYYAERKIKEQRPNVLVLTWQLSRTANYTLQQSFYLGFVNALRRTIIDKKIIEEINKGLNPDFFKNYSLIKQKLSTSDYTKLILLIEEYRKFKVRINLNNPEILQQISDKNNEIHKFLKMNTGVELTTDEINDLGELMLEDLKYVSLLEPDLDHDTIKSRFVSILRSLQNTYTTIVLLIDEFDILIRNYRDDVPSNIINEVKEFIIWLDKEDFKGYHIIGAMFIENHRRLVTAQDGTQEDSIYRRLNNFVVLEPLSEFEQFFKHIFLNYIREAGIDEDFEIFNQDFIHFMFYACGRKLGTILSYLHENFISWQEEIEKNHALFEEDKNISKIGMNKLLWDEEGLQKSFDMKFLKLIEDADDVKNYKRIFTYLLGNREYFDLAPTYEKISTDTGISETIIARFHRDLYGSEIYQDVLPKTDSDTMFFQYEFTPVLFNISSTETELPTPPNEGGNNVDRNSIYFHDFLGTFTIKKKNKFDDKDWDFYVNEGFRYLMNDYLKSEPNPFTNIFIKENVKIEPFNLHEFLENYGNTNLVDLCIQFEANITNSFDNRFKIYITIIKIFEKENDILKQQFMLVFLPINSPLKIEIDKDLINLFEGILTSINYNNKSFESVIIFSNYKIEYTNFEYLYKTIKEDVPWIHRLDQICPITVIHSTQILKKGEKTLAFLSKKTYFEYFCAAFYKLHREGPQQNTKTYYELLFNSENEQISQFNEGIMQNVLNHIFQKYQNLFQTYSHDLITGAYKKNNSEDIAKVNISHFPKFIRNFFLLNEYDFPVSSNGYMCRQQLDLPFKIDNHTKDNLLNCLKDLINLPVIEIKTRDTRDVGRMSSLKTLIEANLINFNISKDGIKFSIRNDSDSILTKFENIVKENTNEDQKFNVLDLKLKNCNRRLTASIPTIECFLELLKKNRKIFDYYPELDEEVSEEISN